MAHDLAPVVVDGSHIDREGCVSSGDATENRKFLSSKLRNGEQRETVSSSSEPQIRPWLNEEISSKEKNAMTRKRSKTQIKQLIADDQNYREDLEYIQATLAEGNVFIGQITSEQSGNTEAAFCVTVGMFQHRLPELVFSGVPVPVVKNIVQDLCEGNDFDREFLAGGRTKVILDFNVIAVPVSDPEIHDVLSVCHDVYTLIDKIGRAHV